MELVHVSDLLGVEFSNVVFTHFSWLYRALRAQAPQPLGRERVALIGDYSRCHERASSWFGLYPAPPYEDPRFSAEL